jgi:hypothetical protein
MQSKVCLHIFLYPKIHISFLGVGKKECNTLVCLGEKPNTTLNDPRELFEELSYVYIFQIQMKTQVSELIDAKGFKSLLFPLFNYPR